MKKITVATLFVLVVIFACGKKEQTGPVITLYSDIYQIGDQWYCPICDQPVKNGDRSDIDANLYLSEWHDEFLDPGYFDKKINNISDVGFLRSVDLKVADTTNAERSLHQVIDYFSNRRDNQRLHWYDPNAEYFITIDEFVRRVESDPARRQQILQAAMDVAHPDSGYTIGEEKFGWQINFNTDWQYSSDYIVNGLGYLPSLVNAYLITGNDFWLTSYEDIFNQWYEQRNTLEHHRKPWQLKVYGIIWYELATSSRLIRLVDGYRAIGDHLSPQTQKRMLKIILGSGRWLYQSLSRVPFHPYNWQTANARTMTYLALTFPEFVEAPVWLNLADQNMKRHFHNDILDDGGYIERSVGYTIYTYGMLYGYLLMHKHFDNNLEPMQTYMPRLESLMEFTALTMTPVGVNCAFNDCARGTRFADFLVEMAEVFQRGDFVGAVEHRLPPSDIAELSVEPVQPAHKSKLFPHSKFVVMREDWHPNACFMMINYGPWANHAHYDMLDFEAYANGIPIALDAGLGERGYLEPNHVSWYKQSPAHNMLMIDNANTNKRFVEGYDSLWAAQAYTDYFAATHDGYKEFHDTICRRHFAFVRGEYWVLLDQIFTPHKGKTMDHMLHTPLHMQQLENGYISDERPGALFLIPEEETENIERIKRMGEADLRGLEGEPANREIDWLTFRRVSMADAQQDHIAVLLYPLEKNVEDIRFNQLESELPGVFIYQVTGDGFTDTLVFSDGKQHRFSDQLDGDFVFAWLRSEGGNPAVISAVQTSQLNWQQQVSLKFAEPKNYELTLNSGGQ
ncbi:hypothetical protein GF407_17490 [candidate division KSB1 bacterium]|nr:hypothetical protein [candidate division KSB1 bacterium]